MLKTTLNFPRVWLVAILVSPLLAAQDAPYDSAKPLPHATLFAPGVISTGDYESHATFTPDGREIYFLKMAPNFSRWSFAELDEHVELHLSFQVPIVQDHSHCNDVGPRQRILKEITTCHADAIVQFRRGNVCSGRGGVKGINPALESANGK